MEEVIEHVSGNRSAHELAIHFLLRHAERRMALTIETDDQLCAEAPLCRLNSGIEAQHEPTNARLIDAVATEGTGDAWIISRDSFTTRFSLAYTAARAI